MKHERVHSLCSERHRWCCTASTRKRSPQQHAKALFMTRQLCTSSTGRNRCCCSALLRFVHTPHMVFQTCTLSLSHGVNSNERHNNRFAYFESCGYSSFQKSGAALMTLSPCREACSMHSHTHTSIVSAPRSFVLDCQASTATTRTRTRPSTMFSPFCLFRHFLSCSCGL